MFGIFLNSWWYKEVDEDDENYEEIKDDDSDDGWLFMFGFIGVGL